MHQFIMSRLFANTQQLHNGGLPEKPVLVALLTIE